ncbi:Uncharacterised protein [Enterobacter cloacae]|nr:Uncharacterised protein [Enterobacter cloacae]
MVWPEPIAPVMVPTSSIAWVITGAAGAVVSTTSVKPGEAGLTLPAASVAVAVQVWLPFASVPVVKLHTPLASATAVPTC